MSACRAKSEYFMIIYNLGMAVIISPYFLNKDWLSCKGKCIYVNIGRKSKTRVKTVACSINKTHCSSNKFEKCVVSSKAGKPASL